MKMVNACKSIKRKKESQYISFKPIFVTVSPETDSPKHLKDFQNLYDPRAGLICLREDSSKNPNLKSMLQRYKVPIEYTPDEIEKVNEYFEKAYQKDKKWYQFWKRKKSYVHEYDTKHSRVIYLMGTDNKFLQFYDLDIEQNDFVESIMDEISYDIGIQYLGTGGRPVTRN